MNDAPDGGTPQWAKWLLDAGVGVGLAVAVAAVVLLSGRGGTPAAPPVVPDVSEHPALAKAAIPPMPFIPLTLTDGITDKTPPPLPPLPSVPEDDAPPPKEEAVDTNEVKAGAVAMVGFYGGYDFGVQVDTGDGKERKRLTMNQYGRTNHTLVSVGSTAAKMSDARYFDDEQGIVVKDLAVDGTIETESSVKGEKKARKGEGGQLVGDGPYITQWLFHDVLVERKVEYVAGAVSREMDTLKVTFTMTNNKPFAMRCGVRVMIDTLIGSNDGVPFYVQGGNGGLIDKPTEFKGKDVPDTLFALEHQNDLTDPKMTVVQMGFGGQGNEKPDRLLLSQWPGDPKKAKDFPDDQQLSVQNLPGNWKLADTFNGDSAVALFYMPKEIKPKGTRTFSFTYGLGSLSSGKSRNPTLALAPAGPFVAGQPFRLTALVKDPADKQAVKLTLPPGLKLADHETAEKVVDAKPGVKIAKADWEVVIDADVGGKQTVKAQLVGTDTSETATVFVDNPQPVLHSVSVTGRAVPGGLVRVTATVLKPKGGMTATLAVPKGASLETKGGETQAVAGGKAAQPSWLVRLDDSAAGQLKFTVRTSDPAAEQSATATVAPPTTALGDVRVDGQAVGGGVLRVTAQVVYPKAGHKLTLSLPAGLTLAKDETAEKPLADGRVAQLSWLVAVAPTATGKASLTVKLTPGTEAATRAVDIQPAKPILEVRRADEAAVSPGKPFWVVARVFHSPGTTSATVTLPKGMKLADGHAATKPLEAKSRDGVGYAEAAWPVVLDEYTEPKMAVSVSARGAGEQAVTVACERGSLIGK